MTVLVAPAKLTWTLEILGRRRDGFHDLRSEMVSLALSDSLELTESEKTTVRWAGVDDMSLVPSSSTDLVARALRAVNRTANVLVTKQIPVGGGLGGLLLVILILWLLFGRGRV